jgi:SNF2 family DNA or RNA helicase
MRFKPYPNPILMLKSNSKENDSIDFLSLHKTEESSQKAKLGIKLYEYQEDAISFLKRKFEQKLKGAIVDIPMGFGKTLIVLFFFRIISESCSREAKLTMLFLTKQDIVAHIKNEIKKYVPYSLQNLIIVKPYSNQYEFADIIVVDESHEIFNKKKFTSNIQTIFKDAFTVLLSGSTGSTREVKLQWTNLVCTESEPVIFKSDKLSNVVNVVKEQVLQFDMTETEHIKYNEKKNKIKSLSNGLEIMHSMKNLREWLAELKVKHLIVLLQRALKETDEKIVVFSSFNSILQALRLELPVNEVASMYASNPKKRAKEMELFKVCKRILLVSTNLGSHGIDLGFVKFLIHVEPPWKGVTQCQANSRIMRIGQKANQEIFVLVMKQTLESKLLASNLQSVLEI